MKLGKFSQYLQDSTNSELELQKVSHLKWKIDGQQLESFGEVNKLKVKI